MKPYTAVSDELPKLPKPAGFNYDTGADMGSPYYTETQMRAYATATIRSLSTGTDAGVRVKGGRGIYIASKVKHAERWRDLRDFEHDPIISTWIDEAGVGESASLEDLWRRCVHEASNAGALIIYCEPGEILKGAWVELGAALANGVPVFAVGIEGFTVSNHAGITHCSSIIEARRLARAALEQQPAASQEGEVSERIADLEAALEAAANRFHNIRGAVETNQVVDKDVRGSAIRGRDLCRAALTGKVSP